MTGLPAEEKYSVTLTKEDVRAIKESCAHVAGSRGDYSRLQAGSNAESTGSPVKPLKGSPIQPIPAVLASTHSPGMQPQFSEPPEMCEHLACLTEPCLRFCWCYKLWSRRHRLEIIVLDVIQSWCLP